MIDPEKAETMSLCSISSISSIKVKIESILLRKKMIFSERIKA